MRQNEGVKGDARTREITDKTLQRRQFIQKAAEDLSLLLPDRVREFAQEAWQEVKDAPVTGGGHGCVQPAYDRLKLMIRETGGARRECDGCGQLFTLQRIDALFCSDSCRKQASRDRYKGTAGIRRPSRRPAP
jgi:hypothetical protein